MFLRPGYQRALRVRGKNTSDVIFLTHSGNSQPISLNLHTFFFGAPLMFLQVNTELKASIQSIDGGKSLCCTGLRQPL